jgi:hypothetical protein
MLKNLAANPKKKERSIDDTSTSTARATQEEVNRSMGKGELECGKRKKALRLVPVMRESTTGAHILDVAAGVKCPELLATGETKVARQLGLPQVPCCTKRSMFFGFWLLPRNATTRSVRPKIATRDQSEMNEGKKKEQYGSLVLS